MADEGEDWGVASGGGGMENMGEGGSKGRSRTGGSAHSLYLDTKNPD